MRISPSGAPIGRAMRPAKSCWAGARSRVRRPRVRRDGQEVSLPTVQAFTNTDPLNRRVVEQLLVGVATRQYGRSLEPLGADVRTRGTSKSAVSRRFVAQTQAQLDAWRATPLDALDLVALLIDGVQVGGHCIVVALGIEKTGQKHPLGLWEGSTENTTVCQGLLANLQSRGLRTDRSLLVILDGAKALHTAVTQTFGRAALVQRCQVHKRPERARVSAQGPAPVGEGYPHARLYEPRRQGCPAPVTGPGPPVGGRLPECHRQRAGRPRRDAHGDRGAALCATLQRSLATTNAVESLLSRTRHVKRNVKRWRGGTMVLRWVAAGVLEAAKGFRRVKGCTDMPRLVAALRARDAQLGLGDSSEMVA